MSFAYQPGAPRPTTIQASVGFGTYLLLLLVVAIVAGLVAAGVMFFAVGMAPPSMPGLSAEDEVRNVAREFFEFALANDLDGASRLAVPEDRELVKKMGTPPPGMMVIVQGVTLRGNEASADVMMLREGESDSRVQPLALRREADGKWYVWLSKPGGPVERAIEDSKKTVDAVNLKRLVEIYMAGQAQARAKRTPRSKGRLFWIALCVGDGPGAGNLEVMGMDDPDMYVSPRDIAHLLVSPNDPDVLSYDEIVRALEGAIEAGTGVVGLEHPELLCSYAGPTDGRKAMLSRAIVGVTGTRDGISVFHDGFNAVTSSGEAMWYSYEEMIRDHGWPEGTDRPLYGTAPLDQVSE
ncbi:MAG: hypothetical protein AB7K09_19730 [Planctomycetota bacterium]